MLMAMHMLQEVLLLLSSELCGTSACMNRFVSTTSHCIKWGDLHHCHHGHKMRILLTLSMPHSGSFLAPYLHPRMHLTTSLPMIVKHLRVMMRLGDELSQSLIAC